MTEAATLTRACWQPWESLNVAADGKVYPCCVVAPALEVGDLTSQPLHEIVVGEAMIQFKHKLLAGDIDALSCAKCPNAPMQTVSEFKHALIARYRL